MSEADPIVAEALRRWGFAPQASLVAQRENRVYRVADSQGRPRALRLHRPGYRRDAELASELDWLAMLAAGGLSVATPVAAVDGALLQRVDGVQVSVLHWLDGVPMGATGTPLQLADRRGCFRALGAGMARLHQLSDAWRPPAGFQRGAWDLDGLLGERPLWGRFWENPALDSDQRAALVRWRAIARQRLVDAAGLDTGLIHADLLRENILVSGAQLHFIDFDDGGHGYRLFDLATALLKNRHEEDYEQLRRALIAGYHSVRPLDVELLPLFMLLRALTYVGWIAARMDEPGSALRCRRMIDDAMAMGRACMPVDATQ